MFGWQVNIRGVCVCIANVLLTFAFFPTHAVAQKRTEPIQPDFQFLMMRHARAPGTGDPAGFKLDDCATQRNLSNEGIEQAKRIGKTLPKNITVYSSQWCRTLDTARFLNRGEVTELSLLNSFFNDRSKENPQTQSLKKWLKLETQKQKPFILVTHQVNITALTGIFPEEGEILYLSINDDDSVQVLKRVKP